MSLDLPGFQEVRLFESSHPRLPFGVVYTESMQFDGGDLGLGAVQSTCAFETESDRRNYLEILSLRYQLSHARVLEKALAEIRTLEGARRNYRRALKESKR